MQVNKFSRYNPNFNGVLNNKFLLKGLEKIADHGTSFSATTSLFMSLSVRPFAINATPNVEKENKQYASSNSICSGLMKFGMVEAVALPIEKAVQKLNETPHTFLKPNTIKNLKQGSEELLKSQSYRLATQIFKLGVGFITAIPKSVLTIALIPIVMDNLYHQKDTQKEENSSQNPAFKHFLQPERPVAFTGSITDKAAKGLAKILDNKKFQNFVIKNQSKEKDIAKHISAGTDILLTTTSAIQTEKSKHIKENRKKALIYNNITSTAITIGGLYGIDRLFKNKTGKFIEKFARINAGNPKLSKYIEGIHILRPALISAGIYYGILPMFSTYIAEKTDKFIERNK